MKKNFLIQEKKNDPLSFSEDWFTLLSNKENLYKGIESKLDYSLNINIVNLYNLFTNTEEEIFYSMVHVNDKGQEMISDIILENIKKDIDYE